MTNNIEQCAEELPDYQTSRGNEFRNISFEERLPLARRLVRARSQANASNRDFDDPAQRREMARKRGDFFYEAGALGIEHRQARSIWMNYVYSGAAPHERRELI